MKTFKNLFAIIALLVFVTSCQKDEIHNDMSNDLMALDDLSGELVNDNKISQMEFDNQKSSVTKIKSSAKKVNLKDIKMKQDFTRSRTISPLYCGDAITGSTEGETSSIDIYVGADKVYLLQVDQVTSVEINLSNLASDLDLYLTTIETDQFGNDVVGDVIANSLNYDLSDEYVNASLEPGDYYVIVETFGNEGFYGIVVECAIVGTPVSINCDDHENLQCSYSYGVSTQSDLWSRWSSRSRDGLVLTENSWTANKVVKFDAGRFGYQDAVRSLMNQPITNGVVKMSWKMYIPANRRADFVTEKTQFHGQEQGLAIKMDNGLIRARSGLSERIANTRFATDEWIDVEMVFDMKYNTVYTTIADQVQIVSGTDAKVGKSNFGIHSIFGVDFFNKAYHSKFRLDDICVEVMENSVDPANFQNAQMEYIDLRIL